MRFRDVVLEADKPNKNKRTYPRAVLERIVENCRDVVLVRAMYGQMGHSDDAVIHFSQISHLVTDLSLDGDKMVAEIETTSTPQGLVLEQLIASGEVSLRPFGVGSVSDDGVIGDDYKMVSVSAVLTKEAA